MNWKKLLVLFLIDFVFIVFFIYKDSINTLLEDEAIYNEEYITVYLAGEAKITGPYEVPKTWTLSDLINLVGVTNDADTSSLNYKEVLAENETYTIPKALGTSSDTLININTASKEDLMKLPSIGEATAERIISYRTSTPFLKIEDIKNVSGIGDKLYEKIKGLITV